MPTSFLVQDFQRPITMIVGCRIYGTNFSDWGEEGEPHMHTHILYMDTYGYIRTVDIVWFHIP